MPFTASHAVVALPFVRTPLVPAAIAIGAMAPDLPLFLRYTPLTYGLTHTNVAVSTAVAAVLLVLWWYVLRPAIRELSPISLARRLPRTWDTPGRPVTGGASSGIRTVVVIVLSLVLGVVSHIAWDAFTHEGRAGSDILPFLAQQWGLLPGYRWLQYVSSGGGLVILAVSGAFWIARRDAGDAPTRMLPHAARVAWWLALPVLLIGAWVIGLATFGPLTVEFTAQHLAYRVLPPACAVWAMITFVLALFISLRRSVVSRRGRSSGEAT